MSLLKRAKDVNVLDSRGRHLLMMVSRTPTINMDKVALELIAKGANVNYQDEEGTSPLIIAVSHSNPSVLKVLVENGAAINEIDKYLCTALTYACEQNYFEMIEFLIEHRAIPKKKDLVLIAKNVTFTGDIRGVALLSKFLEMIDD